MSIVNSIRKTMRFAKKNGYLAAAYTAMERMEQKKQLPYTYQEPSEEELQRQRNYIFKEKYLFSVIVPAYETKPMFMQALIASLQAQTYSHFELIIADASQSDIVEQTVSAYQDERIQYRKLSSNGGIAENTNQAMQFAKGAYCGLLDHDDILTPDALFEMAFGIEQAKQKGTEPAFLYSDEDKCDMDEAVYFDPHNKLDFNQELLLTNNYICHFLVIETGLLQRVKFRKAYDGAQDFDLVLRLLQDVSSQCQTGEQVDAKIIHIPKVLYHWRCHTGSTADNPESKMYAYEAGKYALEDYYKKNNLKVEVRHAMHLGFYQTEYMPQDSFFLQRKEVGVVGGLLIKHGKVVGGAYNQGKTLYEGLQQHFAGLFNRAHLMQNVDSVDVRCMKIAPRWIPLYEEIIGIPYQNTFPEYTEDALQKEGTLPVLTMQGRQDPFGNMSNEEIKRRSQLFCEKVKETGEYIILNPMHRIRL